MRNFFQVPEFCRFLRKYTVIFFVLFSQTVPLFPEIVDENLPYRQGFKASDFLLLHAGLTGRAVYDSNIFLSDRNEEEDLIFYLVPSIGFEIPFREHLFSAEYDLTSAFFTDHDEENYTDHRLMGLMEFNFTRHKITFEDVYKTLTNRAGQDDDGVVGVQLEEDRNEFEANLSAVYDQFEYSISYQNFYREYDNGEEILFEEMRYSDRDYFNHAVNAEAGYRISAKTSVLIEAEVGRIEYDSEENLVPDSYYFALMPGLKNESLKNTVIEFRVGPWFQDYGSSNLVRNDDHDDVVGIGSIQYEFSKDDTIKLSYERSIRESYYDINPYSVTDFFGAEYTHRFRNQIMLILYATWQQRDFPYETTEDSVTAKRDDDIYALGSKLRWDVREWMSVEAGYEYHERNSNFSTFDYDGHMVSIRGTVGV